MCAGKWAIIKLFGRLTHKFWWLTCQKIPLFAEVHAQQPPNKSSKHLYFGPFTCAHLCSKPSESFVTCSQNHDLSHALQWLNQQKSIILLENPPPTHKECSADRFTTFTESTDNCAFHEPRIIKKSHGSAEKEQKEWDMVDLLKKASCDLRMFEPYSQNLPPAHENKEFE